MDCPLSRAQGEGLGVRASPRSTPLSWSASGAAGSPPWTREASRTPSRSATPCWTASSTRRSTRSRRPAIRASCAGSATSWRTRRSAWWWTTTRTRTGRGWPGSRCAARRAWWRTRPSASGRWPPCAPATASTGRWPWRGCRCSGSRRRASSAGPGVRVRRGYASPCPSPGAYPAAQARVQQVADAVAEQVQPEHRHHQRGARGDHRPGRLGQEVAGIAEHLPPGRDLRRRPDARGSSGRPRRGPPPRRRTSPGRSSARGSSAGCGGA